MRRIGAGLAVFALGVAAVAGAAPPPAMSRDSHGADEYRVKAAIVYNLAKFVEWPAEAFNSEAAPLTVCVLGLDPFGSVLDQALNGHQVGGRAMEVRRISDPEAGCHLLFMSRSEQKRMRVIADQLKTLSILTISEQEGFAASGGMIELFTEGDRVRFAINIVALERAGLRVSARLREIASKHAPDGRP